MTGKTLTLALAAAIAVAPTMALAASVTGTGTIVMHDKYGTKKVWGRDLVLPKDATITQVIDGTYGFKLYEDGQRVAAFAAPQSAVGTKLSAGDYRIEPNVIKTHRHHHVEVTAEY